MEAAYSGTVLESPVWRRSLVLHYVPVTVEEGEVVSEERAAARAAPHRGHPASSTPHPEPAARLLSPPPSAPQEPTREPTRYGDLGSGNLLSMTPTVIASPSVESSAMVMVTPSPAPLSPLKSPRRLPSARFDDESGGESEDEAEGNASWSDEVEEAIEATNQSELERKKEMEKEESEPKTEKGESEERRKSAGEKASEKRNRAVVLVSDQVKLASIEQIRIESPDILGIDNESVRRLGDLLACTPTEAGVVVAGDFNLPRCRPRPSPPAGHRDVSLPIGLPPLQRSCAGRPRS